MTYETALIDIAVRKLKKNTNCEPIEESVLNLYIHDVCEEIIKEFHLNIKTKNLNNRYVKFFDKVKSTYLNE